MRYGITCIAVLVLAIAQLSAGEPQILATYRSPNVETARAQAWDWLKSAGKDNETTRRDFDAIWSATEVSLLERMADTLALGNADASRVLAEIRKPLGSSPRELPAILRDRQQPAVLRANLALAYSRELSNHRNYEDALVVLKNVRPEEIIDPAAYFFHRALAEYCLMRPAEAARSISRLGDVTDAPDRYIQLAGLMQVQMKTWKEKDLDWAARTMANVGRRLEQGRGGPATQKLQRDIIKCLDDLIDEQQPPPEPPGPPMPPAPTPPGPQPPGPPLPPGGNNNQSGPGNVTDIHLAIIVGGWGKLPEKERARMTHELIRSLPPHYREIVEEYFRRCIRD